MSETQALQAKLVGDIEAAADLEAIETLRVAALGKAGIVTGLLKTLGGMTPEERQVEGPKIHALREAVTEAIMQSAGTGKIGDGKIFVFDIEQVVRIRTGETGGDAL